MPASDAIWMAMALVLVFEGLLPALNPAAWRRLFEQMLQLPDHQIRVFGLCSMVLGLVILWGLCALNFRICRAPPVESLFYPPAHFPMSSAWLLPEHIADVLPAQARRLEELRRVWLDVARGYGFELVMPPLLEHLDSLLSGTGHALDLRTFKLVDQLSGRSLGVRADATPQVARIDAHLLNRQGVTRLCYCGPVLHARPASPHASREPLQLGAEIYGHAGLEADLEAAELALDGLQAAGLTDLVMDLADVRLVDGVLAGLGVADLPAAERDALIAALSSKDVGTLRQLAQQGRLASSSQAGAVLVALTRLYGDEAH